MNFEDYQVAVAEWTDEFMPGYTTEYALIKLFEEVGEIAQLIAKQTYNKPKSIEERINVKTRIAEEIGDAISVLSSLANSYGLSLDLCAVSSVSKLKRTTYAKHSANETLRR